MNDFGLILDKEKTIERVFKICQFYNVKNVDLAELMYTTEVEISNWKTGKRFPDWDKILLFAYVFGVSLDDLIVRKKTDKNNALDDIREKIKKIDKKNLLKTLDKKYNNSETLSPECHRNVRWNPLLQDWVPLEKYNETIEQALLNAKKN
jgi:transcriptional regulator with XRE-family HTH domain